MTDVAEILRRHAKELADLRRRLNTIVMTGTAEANQGAKTKVRFDDEAADGKPFSSPFLAQASPAGKMGGGVSQFTKIGTGEPVLVFSPGGELGEHSRVMPAGHVEQHPSPGSAEQDGLVIVAGTATLAVRDGRIRVTVGEGGFELTAAALQMLGTFKAKGGSRPAHYVGGLDDGGDTAVDGNADMLI